jgi:hypothetical protein
MPELRAMPAPTPTRFGSALKPSFGTPPMNGCARFVARSHARGRYPAEGNVREAAGWRDGLGGYFGLDSVSGWP